MGMIFNNDGRPFKRVVSKPLKREETTFEHKFAIYNYDDPNGFENYKKALIDEKYSEKIAYAYALAASKMQTSGPVPVNFIKNYQKELKTQAKKKNKLIKTRDRLEKIDKFDPEAQIKSYWNDFKNYLKKKFRNTVNYIKSNVSDFVFLMSLTSSQRRLIKGFKRSETSKTLIGLALHKNLDLNEVKNMNKRVDAIPE